MPAIRKLYLGFGNVISTDEDKRQGQGRRLVRTLDLQDVFAVTTSIGSIMGVIHTYCRINALGLHLQCIALFLTVNGLLLPSV